MSIKTIKVKEQEITFFNKQEEDFISLTDIAKVKNPEDQKMLLKIDFATEVQLNF